MTSYVESDMDVTFPFNPKEVLDKVMEAVLEMEQCPYEACVNLLLTDNEGIRAYNKEYRNIDRETDVLSFPNLSFEEEGNFTGVEDEYADCFDLDSGELLLGDIILSTERVEQQAAEFGHSVLREFAFLIAHSMFHLCGYDHMVEEEAERMEQKQETVLQQLGITRQL